MAAARAGPTIMKFNNQNWSCHAERSEASLCPSSQMLRCAQDDNTPGCHAERSEASLCPSSQMLRCAQDDNTPDCHAERSEASLCPSSQMLRYAQDDNTPDCHAERSEASSADLRVINSMLILLIIHQYAILPSYRSVFFASHRNQPILTALRICSKNK